MAAMRLVPQRGQVLVMVALFLSAFLGMLVLANDIGMGLVQRRVAQNAADAAAMASAKLLARSVSVAANGQVVFVDADDARVWSMAQGFFTANRLITPPNATLSTALEYLDCATSSLGFSSSTSNSLMTGTRLGAGSFVPGATCYVRATSQVQYGSLFAGVLGQTMMTVSARATTRIAPTAMPSGTGTWPITRWLNGSAADCPFDDASPCVFWANNGVPGNTAIGSFKELLDLSRDSAFTAGAQLMTDYDHVWPGANDKNVDLPRWLRYGWQGRLSIGDRVELFGGDMGNNNADAMRAFIVDHSEGVNPSHPERGRFTSMVVFFWDTAENWHSQSNSWQPWNSSNGNSPDRATLSTTRCFRFYENLVNSSSISGFYVSCFNSGTPLAGPPSRYANTVQVVD